MATRNYQILEQVQATVEGSQYGLQLAWVEREIIEAGSPEQANSKWAAANNKTEGVTLLALSESQYDPMSIGLEQRDPVVKVTRSRPKPTRTRKPAANAAATT